MCVHIYGQIGTHLCANICTSVCKPEVDVECPHGKIPTSLFETDLSVKLEFIHLARLAGHPDQGILLSPIVQHWDYRHALLSLVSRRY